MIEKLPSWIGTLLRIAKWASICLIGLILLYVFVVFVGAGLGLWPLSDR